MMGEPHVHDLWLKVLRRDVWFWSFLSLIFSVGASLLYLCLPRWRRAPGWLIQRAVFCDALAAGGSLALWGYMASLEPELNAEGVLYQPMIIMLLAWMMAAEMSASAWRFIMYLHLVVIYRNPFSPDRFSLVYPVVVMALTATATLICMGTAFSHGDDAAHTIKCVVTFFLFCFPAFLVLAGSITQIGVWSAVRSDRRGGHHASISFAARENLIRNSFLYLIHQYVLLALGLMVLMLLAATDWRRLWICRAAIALLCGRPPVSFAGWLAINSRMLGAFWFEPAGRSRPRNEAPSKLPQDIQLAHMYQASEQQGDAAASEEQGALGASGTRGEGSSSSAHVGATELFHRMSLAMGSPRQAVKDFTRSSAVSPGIGVGGHDLMSELRFEVLYDVAQGIGNYAQHQLQTAAWTDRMASACERAGPKSWCGFNTLPPAIDEGAESGKSEVVSFTAGLLNYRRQTISFDSGLSQPPRQSPSAPEHHQVHEFAAIREAFGISPEQYARDFPNDLSRLNSRWVQRLRESVSEGASGSFFYRVLSDSTTGMSSRFIVKEISYAEKNTLLAILPEYRQHIQARKGRSFIQYFGCHSVPLRWKYAARVTFVVMRNFMPVSMWLTFDLKGATANRRALKMNSLMEVKKGNSSEQEDSRGQGARTSYGTLRDWEWMDIDMTSDLSLEHKTAIADILRADSEFLAKQGLLDYSLLVGIHRLPQDIKSSTVLREKRLEELTKAGGYPSLDRQKVYFFGIIDVLERYSLRWRAQHAVLTMAYHLALNGSSADGISAMKPDLYADRFCTFMVREVLQHHGEVPPLEASSFTSTGRWFGRREPPVGIERWGTLWSRRRRGLVRERMEAERSDFLQRIEELERELAGARGRRASWLARQASWWARQAPTDGGGPMVHGNTVF